MDKSKGWWVTGFTDGEGCFYADLSFRMKTTSSGRLVSCVEMASSFSIALRADDRKSLEKIKDYFGCGSIRRKKSTKDSPSSIKAGLKDPKPQVVYSVRKPEDLLATVIPHFEEFPLQSKKAADFDIWKKAITFAVTELRGRKGWLRRYPEKVDELGQMCSSLKEIRTYRPDNGLH